MLRSPQSQKRYDGGYAAGLAGRTAPRLSRCRTTWHGWNNGNAARLAALQKGQK